MDNVIELPAMRKKAVDCDGQRYRCIKCGMTWLQRTSLTHAVYCGCGGECRPYGSGKDAVAVNLGDELASVARIGVLG